jgi:predicted chitinase
MAQCAHETANFTKMKEMGDAKTFAKYDPKHNPAKAKRLGNVKAGDGARNHGRGYIQLTGRDNYRRAGQALGIDLEQFPELALKPNVAAQVAIWYWKNRVQPKLSDPTDVSASTRAINPGLKGLKNRERQFKSYQLAQNESE